MNVLYIKITLCDPQAGVTVDRTFTHYVGLFVVAVASGLRNASARAGSLLLLTYVTLVC